MFFALELQTSGVYVSSHRQGLFTPSKPLIRERKIALRGENACFRSAKSPPRSQIGLTHDQRLLVAFCSE